LVKIRARSNRARANDQVLLQQGRLGFADEARDLLRFRQRRIRFLRFQLILVAAGIRRLCSCPGSAEEGCRLLGHSLPETPYAESERRPRVHVRQAILANSSS